MKEEEEEGEEEEDEPSLFPTADAATLLKASSVSEGGPSGIPFSSATLRRVARTSLSRARASAAASEAEAEAEAEEGGEEGGELAPPPPPAGVVVPAKAHPAAPGDLDRAWGTPICAIVM